MKLSRHARVLLVEILVGLLVVAIGGHYLIRKFDRNLGRIERAEKVRQATYMLGNSVQGHGTAFNVRLLDRTVSLTVAHVCEYIAKSHIAPIRILAILPEEDLCLIQSLKPEAPYLDLSKKSLSKDEEIMALGYPTDYDSVPSFGYLSHVQETAIARQPGDGGECAPYESLEVIGSFLGLIEIKACVHRYLTQATNVIIFPGNSGSPVVDRTGDLVGIMSAGNGQTNFGHMLSIEDIKEFLAAYLRSRE